MRSLPGSSPWLGDGSRFSWDLEAALSAACVEPQPDVASSCLEVPLLDSTLLANSSYPLVVQTGAGDVCICL